MISDLQMRNLRSPEVNHMHLLDQPVKMTQNAQLISIQSLLLETLDLYFCPFLFVLFWFPFLETGACYVVQLAQNVLSFCTPKCWIGSTSQCVCLVLLTLFLNLIFKNNFISTIVTLFPPLLSPSNSFCVCLCVSIYIYIMEIQQS